MYNYHLHCSYNYIIQYHLQPHAPSQKVSTIDSTFHDLTITSSSATSSCAPPAQKVRKITHFMILQLHHPVPSPASHPHPEGAWRGRARARGRGGDVNGSACSRVSTYLTIFHQHITCITIIYNSRPKHVQWKS